MKDFEALNSRFPGAHQFVIAFTPKGSKKEINVIVWATNKLNASQYLILNHIWGEQRTIEYFSDVLF